MPNYYDPKNPHRCILGAVPKNPRGPIADLIRSAGKDITPAAAEKIRRALQEQGLIPTLRQSETADTLTDESLTRESLIDETIGEDSRKTA